MSKYVIFCRRRLPKAIFYGKFCFETHKKPTPPFLGMKPPKWGGRSIDLCVNAPKKRLNASKCTYAQALICALSKSKGKFCYLGAVFTARSVGVTALLPQGLRFQRTIACAYLSEPSAVSSPEESFVCSECVASSVVSAGVSDCSIGVNPTTSPTGNVKAIP